MIRTKSDLMYLLGVDSHGEIAAMVQKNTATPTWVAIKEDGITIGPLLDDAEENSLAAIDLIYPFEDKQWGYAVNNVERHSYKFKSAVEKPVRQMPRTLLTDLVDRPLDLCIDCGRVLFRRIVVCDACAPPATNPPTRSS